MYYYSTTRVLISCHASYVWELDVDITEQLAEPRHIQSVSQASIRLDIANIAFEMDMTR